VTNRRSDSAVVASLAAKQEITEMIYRYCRGMDRVDRKLSLNVWHPGGTVDYGAAFAGKTAVEFVDWVSEVHETMEATSHQITNILIDLDGEHATSESYVTAALRMKVGEVPSDRIVRGRYLDQWAWQAGRWAIVHRKFEHDLDYSHPVAER
jgi:SnoaL-like domain